MKMNTKIVLVLAAAWMAVFVQEAAGIQIAGGTGGGLRGAASSSIGQLAVRGGSDGGEAAAAAAAAAEPPSCEIFDEMLGRIYYMRDQLDRTTDSLGSLGYKTGEEWVMDQGIGNVTAATLPSVVCNLLAQHMTTTTTTRMIQTTLKSSPKTERYNYNKDKEQVGLLASTPWFGVPHLAGKLTQEQPQEAEDPQEPTGEEAEEPAPEAKATTKPTEAPATGGWLPSMPEAPGLPGWMGGGKSEGDSEGKKVAATTPQPAPVEGVATTPQPTEPNATAAPAPTRTTLEPANSMEVACPVGSLQQVALAKLSHSFDSIKQDQKALNSIRSIFEELLFGIEKGVKSLYVYRGCPKVDGDEFKTRHVCNAHREAQAQALKLQQDDIAQMQARLWSLQSRLREIDNGESSECFFTMQTTQAPHLNPQQLGWCQQLNAVRDALLDARPVQKQWEKDMGHGMRILGTMSMQLHKNIHDQTLKKDKIPLNALKALTLSWKHLESPTQQLRIMGSLRSEQAANIDGLVLELSGYLKNESSQGQCISERFRSRYGAQTCATLKAQLQEAAEARRTDVAVLEETAQKLMQSASKGLISNKCTAVPMIKGCWLRLPKGCPKMPGWTSADKWTRDTFGEQSTGAATNSVVCSISRKIQIDAMCGTANAEMRFVPA